MKQSLFVLMMICAVSGFGQKPSPPSSFAGIPFSVDEVTLRTMIKERFGVDPTITKEIGNDVLEEDHYYYHYSKLCDRMAVFRWWIGMGGILTHVEIRFQAQIGLVDQCVRQMIPLDHADRMEDGVMPVYYFDLHNGSNVWAFYVPQNMETSLRICWPYRYGQADYWIEHNR